MKRSVLLALVVAFALAIGFSSSAGAGIDGSAEVSAKKGAKKCKGKKGKAKGSATTSGKGKKGKGKSCKAKGKGKKPPAPAPPAPTAPNWPPADGDYSDPGQNVKLSLRNGGTEATVAFGGSATCFPIAISSNPGAVTTTATSLQASGTIGTSSSVKGKWSITVLSDFSYELVTDSSLEFPETTPCNKTGVVFKGTLVKAVAPSPY